GFLVGFGTGSANTHDKDLSPGVQEALSDLAAISQVATPDDDGDAEEDMFEQVAEHCRMSALMIYTELVMRHQGKPESAPADKTPPTRH
ncbi:YecA family protein, partial [Alcanivorax sp. HI0083]